MKYGLIVASTPNIGDDIQSLAAKHFLPRVDIYLDRERLDKDYTDEPIKVILNGWYTYSPWRWPPSEKLRPLIIGFHVTPNAVRPMFRPHVIKYFKNHSPIGARDEWTHRVFNHFGIKSYFSGCVTLTLDMWYGRKKRKDYILVVDVPIWIVEYVKKKFRHEVITWSNELYYSLTKRLTNSPQAIKRLASTFPRSLITSLLNIADLYDIKRGRKIPPASRLRIAESVVKLVASASAVVTSRLHVALPALALGTPLIFVPKTIVDVRFSGYEEFFKYVCPEPIAVRCISKARLEDYAIPRHEKLQTMKEDLSSTIRDFIKN